MTYDDIRGHILAAIDLTTPILNDPEIARRLTDPNNEVLFSDLELDSLTAMEVCLTIEDRTGHLIELGDLVVYPGINALAVFLAERGRSAA